MRPRIKRFLSVFPIDETTWGIRGGYDELSRLRLRNEQAIKTFSKLLPYLNGNHEQEEILERVAAEGVEPADARQLLARLEKAQLLEDYDPLDLDEDEIQRHRSQLAFFSRYGAGGGARYQSVLKSARVCVVAEGRLGECIERQLQASGIGHATVLDSGTIRCRPEASNGDGAGGPGSATLQALEAALETAEWLHPPPDLLIFAQESHDPVVLEALDAFSKRHAATWLLVRSLESHEGWVGPLFVPDETPCYRSLEARFRANLPFFREYEALERHLLDTGTASQPCGGLHAFLEALAAIAVVEAVKHLTGIRVSHLAGRFLTVNFLTWGVETHEVLRLPRLGLESMTGPVPLPWKEMPHDVTAAQRENELRARRG